MKNTILSNLRQSIFTGRFLLCVIFVAAAVFLASMETLLDAFRSADPLAYGFHGSFILEAAATDTISFCLPIICTLPFAGSFVDDVKTGFIKLYIHRTSRRAYIFGKVLGCIVSGGLVVVMGLFLAYGTAVLVFLPMEAAPQPDAENPECFRDFLSACGLFFLSGGLWSLFGMTMSARMESKYIAYASPFIIYYVLIILHERYFEWLYVLHPKAWLFPGEEWIIGKWSVVPVVLELMVMTALCFARSAKRRVSEI